MPAATVLTSAEQATPERLTTALSTSGALTAGTVIAVDPDRSRGTGRPMPGCGCFTLPTRPTSLFLKMVHADLGGDESFSDSEVHYYTRDYADVPDAPVVRCHDAAHSTAYRAYHLLQLTLNACDDLDCSALW